LAGLLQSAFPPPPVQLLVAAKAGTAGTVDDRSAGDLQIEHGPLLSSRPLPSLAASCLLIPVKSKPVAIRAPDQSRLDKRSILGSKSVRGGCERI